MQNNPFKQHLHHILNSDERLWLLDDETNQRELNQILLIDLAQHYDPQILTLLFEDEKCKEKFFVQVGENYIFKSNDFQFFLEEHKVDNSYTQCKNRIGLTDGRRFLKDTQDVVLNFPFKDCILEGGQSTEEGQDTYFEYDAKVTATNKKKAYRANQYNQKQAKRKEIFFNEVLAADEIDRLKDEKALVNWKRFSKDGEEKVSEIARDANGTIRENLIIKGNNYLALHSLKKQFAGKVKLIYIDPPYNTGNDSFKYNDNFNHSTWLTFMKNRLEVARELLRHDGVMFVQCDDNEQAYLKVLMDEVFGRGNFVGNFIRKTSSSNRSDYGYIGKEEDYILLYAKKLGQSSIKKELSNMEGYPLQDEFVAQRGKYKLDKLDRSSIRYSQTLDYPIIAPDQSKIYPGGNILDTKWTWRWSREKVVWGIKNKFVEFKCIKGKWNVYSKQYQFVNNKNEKEVKQQPYKNLLTKPDFYNEVGTREHLKLFNQKRFNNPKPEALLQRIIEISTQPNDIILDYHLGSGTTAAVAHKMNRQYIGIEQMDYIETVAVQRLKKVIGGEQGGISKAVEWEGGGSFIYFELAKWNEQAKTQILACQSLAALTTFFDEMVDKYFLNYNLKINEFRAKIMHEENFLNLPLEQQKAMFLTMLDLNQMFVCRSEMGDGKFGLGEKDQKLTKAFYRTQ